MRKLIPWLVYPVVMATPFILFALLQMHGAELKLTTYTVLIVVAAIITLLEFKLPYTPEWRPRVEDLKLDMTFMFAVQLALPPVIGFAFAHLLIEPMRSLNFPLTTLWPHSAPLWLQVLLMIIVADFFRYWLHRAAHTNSYLWKLHSVHHAVEKLYWLNTSRFHPIEKVLQMTMDALPFLLMGVDEKVLSLYYVAYASNGFLQHSNIELRFGLLNYVIGSAELHRWHHSREPKESNANYGNNVIIWDLLFGTWFLPTRRQVQSIGLLHDFPKTFVRQLIAPFIK